MSCEDILPNILEHTLDIQLLIMFVRNGLCQSLHDLR